MGKTVLVSCYAYVGIEDPAALAAWLRTRGPELGVSGRVLLAAEGFSLLLGSEADGAERLIEELRFQACPQLAVPLKLDTVDEPAFPDLKVSLVAEIIATSSAMPASLLLDGRGQPTGAGGEHLSPAEWHAELARRDKPIAVLDVRNGREFAVGHFAGAEDPQTRAFQDWPAYARRRAEELRGKRVLMYCTGGVRCEKASAYLKSLGVPDVAQLRGGIHAYLEEFGARRDSKFQGANFVFHGSGLQRARGVGTVGECLGCRAQEERLSSDRVCAVCRDAVLFCDPCLERRRGVVFCQLHADLDGSYEPWLDQFPAEQLCAQRQQLLDYCRGKLLGKQGRNRRRALNRHIERIDDRLQALAAGAEPMPPTRRCRSCGRRHDVCDGKCVGFFVQPGCRRDQGYVDLSAPPPI